MIPLQRLTIHEDPNPNSMPYHPPTSADELCFPPAAAAANSTLFPWAWYPANYRHTPGHIMTVQMKCNLNSGIWRCFVLFFLLKPEASVVLKLRLSQRQHSVICKYLCILFLFSQLRPGKMHKWKCLLCMVLLTGELSPEWTIRTFHADLLAIAMHILKASIVYHVFPCG